MDEVGRPGDMRGSSVAGAPAGRGDSDADLAARLRAVSARLSRRLARTRSGSALTTTETAVLAAARCGPVGLSRLAADEGMNPTMLSRVVGKLETAGLVERRSDPDDGRAMLVQATVAGSDLHERIRTERTDALSVLLDRLDAGERETLRACLPVLERLVADLQSPRR